jgi:hypothetical protein
MLFELIAEGERSCCIFSIGPSHSQRCKALRPGVKES